MDSIYKSGVISTCIFRALTLCTSAEIYFKPHFWTTGLKLIIYKSRFIPTHISIYKSGHILSHIFGALTVYTSLEIFATAFSDYGFLAHYLLVWIFFHLYFKPLALFTSLDIFPAEILED